jgi:hypothetical protein
MGYSVHAIGFQSNFIVPAKNLDPRATRFVFGGTWTLRIEAYSAKALAAKPEQAEREKWTQKDDHVSLAGPTQDRLPVHLL